jgi:hypothetical protein
MNHHDLSPMSLRGTATTQESAVGTIAASRANEPSCNTRSTLAALLLPPPWASGLSKRAMLYLLALLHVLWPALSCYFSYPARLARVSFRFTFLLQALFTCTVSPELQISLSLHRSPIKEQLFAISTLFVRPQTWSPFIFDHISLFPSSHKDPVTAT